jgi:tetrahydrodipicolinate N-succinyltransferase
MDLIIVGANPLGEYIVKNFQQFGLHHRILGFVDDRLDLQGKKVANIPVLGQVEKVLSNQKSAVVFAVSSFSENSELVRKLTSFSHLEFPNLISSASWISRDCIFGKGNLVLQGSLINFGTMIGSFNFLGENTAIGHESVIGDLCWLGDDVTIGGYVVLENEVTLNKGVWINQGVRIGKASEIGKEVKINEDVPPQTIIQK